MWSVEINSFILHVGKLLLQHLTTYDGNAIRSGGGRGEKNNTNTLVAVKSIVLWVAELATDNLKICKMTQIAVEFGERLNELGCDNHHVG